MSAKFTPGPWEVSHGIIYGNSVGGCRMEEGTHMVAMIRGWGHLQYRDDGEAVQGANAHLIAAAPEMYHELAHSVRLMCNNCNRCELGLHGEPLFQSEVCETYTRKVAVLRKARGE